MVWSMGLKRLGTVVLVALPLLASGQSGTTLEQALEIATQNNGTIMSALLQYQASRSSALVAKSAYYPSLTPTYSYETSRLNTLTGPDVGLLNDVSSTSSVTAAWLLLDDGTRDAAYRRSALFRDASRDTSIATIRRTLFDVHSAFYDAIRAEELLKVRQRQLLRAVEVENQAKAFAEEGAGAQKDVLQATADMLNAKAAEISARNRVSTTRANLKAILGLSGSDQLYTLVSPEVTVEEELQMGLEEAIQLGLDSRQDLSAQQFRVDAQKQSVRLSRINNTAQWTIDARHVKSFSPDPFDRTALVFQVTVPLFDGFSSKESWRAESMTLQALKSDLTQSERQAVAEIETAYNEYYLNNERLVASRAALDAARINYEATFEARKEGAADLIEVLTAQVSLTTAESNMIESRFDSLVSRVRMRLVTGQSIPGEKL